jgi:hypothetical protein
VMLFLVGQALVTIGRLSTAATEAEETARYSATWAARHGDASDAALLARAMAPEASVDAADTANGIAVTVTLEVSVVGPAGSPLTQTVVGRAVVPVSRFRSTP